MVDMVEFGVCTEENDRTCSSLKTNEVVIFKAVVKAIQSLHKKSVKQPFSGIVLEVVPDDNIVKVRYNQGPREFIEDISFCDMLGVYNKYADKIRFGSIIGQFDLLIPA